MVGAQIDRGIGGVGKVGFFEVGVAKQCPLEIAQGKIGFLKRSVAKIDLFGSALPHHQPLKIQTEKIAVIEDAFTKTDRIGSEQALPICHRPVDPDHLARDEIDIAHFTAGEFHEAQVAVFKTAFGKFARGKKSFAEIAGNEGAVVEFGFSDLFAVEIDLFEFLGEYVHVVGDKSRDHVNKAFNLQHKYDYLIAKAYTVRS